jgi:hypothetical protein
MGPFIVSIFQYTCISNKMQRYTFYSYLETALHVSGGTSTHSRERIQLYLQHLVFVTPLLLSATIVEELEPVWVCCGWPTPCFWARSLELLLFACILDTLCLSLVSKRVDKRKVQRENDSKIPLLHVTGCVINCVYLQRVGAPSQSRSLQFPLFWTSNAPSCISVWETWIKSWGILFLYLRLFCMDEKPSYGFTSCLSPTG